jgi:hypothetical protein
MDGSLCSGKKTPDAKAVSPLGDRPLSGARVIPPWSEMRPNRISTGTWVPATVLGR